MSRDGGRGLWILISGYGVITGSSPTQKVFIIFLGFRTYWIHFLIDLRFYWFWSGYEAVIDSEFEWTGVFCPKQYRSNFNIPEMKSFLNLNSKISIVNFYNDNILHFWYCQTNESLELESCFWPDLVLTLIKFTFQSNFSNKKFKFLRVTLSTCKDH